MPWSPRIPLFSEGVGVGGGCKPRNFPFVSEIPLFLIQSGKAVHSSVTNEAAQFPLSKVLNIFLDYDSITKW